MDNIDNVVDFIQECVHYLSSWVCTRTGEFEPVDTSRVRDILMQLVAGGSNNPMSDFKEGVEKGKILLATNCICLLDDYRRECYEKCRKNIEEFEKKYNIKNETD